MENAYFTQSLKPRLVTLLLFLSFCSILLGRERAPLRVLAMGLAALALLLMLRDRTTKLQSSLRWLIAVALWTCGRIELFMDDSQSPVFVSLGYYGNFISIALLAGAAILFVLHRLRSTRFTLRTLIVFVLIGGSSAAFFTHADSPLCMAYGAVGTVVTITFFLMYVIGGNEICDTDLPSRKALDLALPESAEHGNQPPTGQFVAAGMTQDCGDDHG